MLACMAVISLSNMGIRSADLNGGLDDFYMQFAQAFLPQFVGTNRIGHPFAQFIRMVAPVRRTLTERGKPGQGTATDQTSASLHTV